jgi:hypothetical protein
MTEPIPTPPADPPSDPTPIPVPTPTPDPPANPPTDSGDRLDRLENLVTGLVETVSKLIPGDDQPTRKPWTHYGSRER